MDALEFIRERNRMCRRFDRSCDGCPAYENGWLCGSDAWDERLVATVEQWSKEHPIKTRQSVFLEQWPEAEIDVNGVIQLCPMSISAAHRDSNGERKDPTKPCRDCRREFWNRRADNGN